MRNTLLLIPALIFSVLGFQRTAKADLNLHLALVEYAGKLPSLVTSGQTEVNVDLASATSDRFAGGPLDGGKVLFTQTVRIKPGDSTEQAIRMMNEQVVWSGRFGGVQNNALPVNLQLEWQVGLDSGFRKFSRWDFQAGSVIPIGRTIIVENRQTKVTRKRFFKNEGNTTQTKSKAYLLLIQVRG